MVAKSLGNSTKKLVRRFSFDTVVQVRSIRLQYSHFDEGNSIMASSSTSRDPRLNSVQS
jgi:hypothetical protein